MSSHEPDNHVPVLLNEVLDHAPAAVDGWIVDATFGRGGHTGALLQRLPQAVRVLAIDRDPSAVTVARQLAANDRRVIAWHARFAELPAVLAAVPVSGPVRAVLMDLGVSSPQLDHAERGFSFQADAQLDMRMDPTAGVSAADWLDRVSEQELAGVLRRFGEERFAGRIARAVIAARPVTRTAQLAALVADAVPAAARRSATRHPATRTFQAIRIQINDELREVEDGLEHAFAALAPGGRLLVISFHSLEDRLVKQRFRAWTWSPELPRRLPVRDDQQTPPPARVVAGPVRAGAAEVAVNARARSAVLRVIERVA